ncbi:MAG: hypothetical protein KA144_01380 [Xanthomonadaceae bacterium]|nr:hypothetical protein [Xanthomonadaceae bacterium]
MHILIGWGLLVAALAAFVAGLWFLAVPATIAGVVVLVRNPDTPSYGYSHFVAENPGADASPSDADNANDCDDSDAGDSDGGSCDSHGGGDSSD